MIINHIEGIYGIQCKKTKKIYIGQSKSISRRITVHKHKLKYDKHFNEDLQKDYNLYGIDNFEFLILEKCTCNQKDSKERYWVNFFDELIYNRYSGGLKDFESCDKTKKKISEYNKEVMKNPDRRKKCGRVVTEEQKIKHSEIMKGSIPWNKGVPCLEETKKKLSSINKGKKLTEEQLQKRRGRNAKNWIEPTKEMIEDVKNGLSKRNFSKIYPYSEVIWRKIRKSYM